MTEQKLKEIEARCNAATEWTADQCEIKIDHDDGGYIYAPQGAYLGQTLICLGDTYEGSGNDWNFVAHARTDIPALIAALREAWKQIEIYENENTRTN